MQGAQANVGGWVTHVEVARGQLQSQLLVALVPVNVGVGGAGGSERHFPLHYGKVGAYHLLLLAVLVFAVHSKAVVAREQRTHTSIGQLQRVVHVRYGGVAARRAIVYRFVFGHAFHIVGFQQFVGGIALRVAVGDTVSVTLVMRCEVVERHVKHVAAAKFEHGHATRIVVDVHLQRMDTRIEECGSTRLCPRRTAGSPKAA